MAPLTPATITLFNDTPILGIVGYSGAGKTTLMEALIAAFAAAGQRIGALKATHHPVPVDTPGKDSDRMRRSGAAAVLLATPAHWMMAGDRPTGRSTTDEALDDVRRLSTQGLDLILVEGYRDAPWTQLEVHRPRLGKPLLAPGNPRILAVVTDAAGDLGLPIPQLDCNHPAMVAHFIRTQLESGS